MRSNPNPLRYAAEVNPSRRSIWNMYKRLLIHSREKWKTMIGAMVAIIAISLLEFAIPQLTAFTIDHAIPGKRYDQLPWIAVGIVAAALLLSLFTYVSSYLLSYVGLHTINRLRNELYRHIQMQDMAFFDKTRTGDLMSRITGDVSILQQLVSSGMLQMVTELVTFFAIAIYMLYIDPQLTLLMLATFPLLFLFTRKVGRRMRSSFRAVQESSAEVNNHLQENLSGIRLMKAYASESYEAERFTNRTSRNMQASITANRFTAIFAPTIDLLNYVGMAAVLLFGAWQVMSGELSIGAIVAFLAYLRLLQNPVRQLSRMMNMIQQSAAAYERIEEILDTKPSITEKENARPLPIIQGSVEYRHVDFAYQSDVPVLRDFHLTIAPGTMTALVGSSGAGKSTVAHLLSRFYDPSRGTLLVDGIDIKDVQITSLRGQLGIVSQDIVLLNGTIRDNIAYGKPDATDQEVEEAARAANAHEFIQAFPEGYQSPVGERGVKLSGGQKQRLSIARAILKNPRLIILDEATAALDTESEQLIQHALSQLLAGRTCLVIAHRLSTIQQADQIVVLEKGSIIETGTHEELIRHQGRYQQLYELQFPNRHTQELQQKEPLPSPR
ncbi:ABC transporter [Brevibacillus choshinensis]|uniref:ABC transporter n=1 Tax=Brevibacillus choshinensis TaxID=54911 RepID=A0ABR5N855_BRECH|nr:ABC transporter ATP-binding protein [Brevibacillus choshinensis]KQL46791.1 ABC transporter [Brevibacillus choshinensis]